MDSSPERVKELIFILPPGYFTEFSKRDIKDKLRKFRDLDKQAFHQFCKDCFSERSKVPTIETLEKLHLTFKKELESIFDEIPEKNPLFGYTASEKVKCDRLEPTQKVLSAKIDVFCMGKRLIDYIEDARLYNCVGITLV